MRFDLLGQIGKGYF